MKAKRKYTKKANKANSTVASSSSKNDKNMLEIMNQEYEELKERHKKKLIKIKKKLFDIRSLIRKYNFPQLYYKRNIYFRQYSQLNAQKLDIENSVWEKQFVIKYREVFEKLKENKFSGHPEPLKEVVNLDLCKNPNCQQNPLVQIPKEGLIICTKCGHFSRDLSSCTNQLAYGEEVEAPAQHQYERIKNFKAFLQQFSEDAKPIPDELIAQLTHEIRANPNRSQQELRCTPCKNWLKSHPKWKKYSDAAFRICNMINGIYVPKFSKAQSAEYVRDFVIIEMLFFQIKNSPRNNFLNLSFIMNKLTGIRGQKHNQAAFPLLRHKKTLLEQELLWQLMCEKTKWPYERSI